MIDQLNTISAKVRELEAALDKDAREFQQKEVEVKSNSRDQRLTKFPLKYFRR